MDCSVLLYNVAKPPLASRYLYNLSLLISYFSNCKDTHFFLNGKMYFLNTQSKSSLSWLALYSDGGEEEGGGDAAVDVAVLAVGFLLVGGEGGDVGGVGGFDDGVEVEG